MIRLSHIRYAIFRGILPFLKYDPLPNMNLAEKGWPKVSTLTAGRQYSNEIEHIDCGQFGNEEESNLLEEYAKTSRCVVLKSYIRPELAATWTLDWVKNELGDTKDMVRVGDYDSAAGEPEGVKMRVADFIDCLLGRAEFPHKDRLAEGRGPYLGNVKLPSLAKQLPTPSFCSLPPQVVFWLGKDARTPLHCHQFCDTLLIQLNGRRRVILVPPHQAALVGCIPRNVNVCTASLDPFEPDPRYFPDASLIHRLYCELEPGDALLIPGFWFHAVRLTGVSFASSQFNNGIMPLAVGGDPQARWKERAYARGWG